MKAYVNPFHYLAGVVVGDGWCTPLSLGIQVADCDFAEAFATAIAEAFSIAPPTVRQEARGYWVVRMSNKSGRFNALRDVAPDGIDESAAWLRGFFDSEGNALLRRNGMSPNAFGRRVAMYSTNLGTLDRAAGCASRLGIETLLRRTKNSAGHKGTLVVFELALRGARDNYQRFSDLVGSSIERKRTVLAAIPQSYADTFESSSIGGRRGCATRWGINRPRCSAGHRYTAANTEIKKDGKRRCRTCSRRWVRESRARSAMRSS